MILLYLRACSFDLFYEYVLLLYLIFSNLLILSHVRQGRLWSAPRDFCYNSMSNACIHMRVQGIKKI